MLFWLTEALEFTSKRIEDSTFCGNLTGCTALKGGTMSHVASTGHMVRNSIHGKMASFQRVCKAVDLGFLLLDVQSCQCCKNAWDDC